MSVKDSIEMLPRPYEPGQELWMIVNGEPALRYYVRPHNRGHIIAVSLEDASYNYYVDFKLFWPSRDAVLLWLIQSIENRIEYGVEQLRKRRMQLMEGVLFDQKLKCAARRSGDIANPHP